MPLFARLMSNSAFKNGDSFAIVEGNQLPIRVKRIIHGGKTDIAVFSTKDKPGLEYTGEITLPDHPVICLDGGYCDAESFLQAKTLALRQLCTLGSPQPMRVTGPISDYTSRIGNSHSVAVADQPREITIWHLEPPEGSLSRFWFVCKSGIIWRAESLLATHQGIATLATF